MAKKLSHINAASGLEVPLHFNIPVEMPSVYATNLLLQLAEHEVIISFYEAQVPFLTDKEEIETLKKVGIRADCVAKVTIAKQRFEGFAKVIKGLSDQIAKLEKENAKNT